MYLNYAKYCPLNSIHSLTITFCKSQYKIRYFAKGFGYRESIVNIIDEDLLIQWLEKNKKAREISAIIDPIEKIDDIYKWKKISKHFFENYMENEDIVKNLIREIYPTLFYDTTNKEREKLITGLYGLLCKYTHASIVVTIFKEIKNDKEKEVLRLFMDYNLYFIKLILLDCMRYLNEDKRNYIDEETIGFCIFLNIIKILNIIQNDKMNFEKFINLLYYDSV